MEPITRRRLATELVKLGMTQWQLAKALGVAPSTLSGWLSGAHPAPSDLASRIAGKLGITADVIVG